jgi:phosphonate transport system substrate-binding protein
MTREVTNMTSILLGAVAYDPKVVTIWEGFKGYFQQQGLSFDYVLYSNYERQVEALLEGTIHVAWNSPLGSIPKDGWRP